MADNDGGKTVIGNATSVQLSVLVLAMVGVAGGGIWVGKSSSEFETLKTIVYEIRNDVRELSIKVNHLPQTNDPTRR